MHAKDPVVFSSLLGRAWLSFEAPGVSLANPACVQVRLPEKCLSQITPMEKLSPVHGLVGFGSDLSKTAQLLLVASKPRGFTYEFRAGREGGWSEDWMRLARSRRLQSQQLAPPGLYPVSARFTFP